MERTMNIDIIKEEYRYGIKGTRINNNWVPFDLKIIVLKYKKDNKDFIICH